MIQLKSWILIWLLRGPLLSLKMSSIKKNQIYENNGDGQRLSGGLRYIICLVWTFCKILLFYTFLPKKGRLNFHFCLKYSYVGDVVISRYHKTRLTPNFVKFQVKIFYTVFKKTLRGARPPFTGVKLHVIKCSKKHFF